MRDWNGGRWVGSRGSLPPLGLMGATEGGPLEVKVEARRVCLLVWVRARVRAPAMEVVGVVEREEAVVVVRRWVREVWRVSSTRRKGRYLLASEMWVGAVGWRVRGGGPLELGLRPLRVSFGFGGCGVLVEEVVGGSASAISMSGEGLAASCCGVVLSSVAEEG